MLSIILVKRRDPPLHTHAIPGGFVNIGEDMHAAVIREVFEVGAAPPFIFHSVSMSTMPDTSIWYPTCPPPPPGLTMDADHIELFRVKSDPHRDKRRHTVSLVYRCRVPNNDLSALKKKGGDDAKGVDVVPVGSLKDLKLAFDHKKILHEYLETYHPDVARGARLGKV